MKIQIAEKKHIKYCKIISETISSSAKVRGTGIALRSPEYIRKKIELIKINCYLINNILDF